MSDDPRDYSEATPLPPDPRDPEPQTPAANQAGDTVSGEAGQEDRAGGGAFPPPPPPPQRPRLPQVVVPASLPLNTAGGAGRTGTPPPGGGTTPRASGMSALWVVVMIVVLGLITIVVGGYLVGQMGEGSSIALRGGKVGVITVSGVIQDGGRGGLLMGPPGARAIMEDLRSAGEDAEIKAVVLLINSPGGSPAASHAIFQEIQRLRKTKKVVACMTDIAASGGYYISAAADKIVAQNSTLTGSIGVIFGGLGYYGLMDKLGIVDQTQTAGRYKDVGSPLRPMKDYEKQLVQGLLDSIYQQFIQAVAEGRQMPLAKVKPLAEGRIYTGEQAQKVGLVDELGNFYDAVKLAGKLGGITGEPKVKYLGAPKGLWQELMATESLLNRHFKGGRGWLPDPTLVGPMLVVPWAYPGLSGEENGWPAVR